MSEGLTSFAHEGRRRPETTVRRVADPCIGRPGGHLQFGDTVTAEEIKAKHFNRKEIAWFDVAERVVRPFFGSMEIHVDFREDILLVLYQDLNSHYFTHAVMGKGKEPKASPPCQTPAAAPDHPAPTIPPGL